MVAILDTSDHADYHISMARRSKSRRDTRDRKWLTFPDSALRERLEAQAKIEDRTFNQMTIVLIKEALAAREQKRTEAA